MENAKNLTYWMPANGKGFVINIGNAFLVDNSGNFLIDNSSNFLVTTPTIVNPLNPTAWSVSPAR
jgi:hypothetical protein